MTRVPVVRLGIVGVGDFGSRHARTAAALPEFDVRGVADLDPTRAQGIALEVGCRAHSAVEALIAREALNAIVIATPEAAHLEAVEHAAEAGLHALVEKPVALSSAEAAQVRDRAARSDTIVIPAHVSRFLPEIAELRALARSERIVAVHASRSVPKARLDLHGRTHPALMAMIHDLDLVRSIAPAEAVSVTAQQSWVEETRPHPQLVSATLRFSDGCVATIENDWMLPHERQYVDARMRIVAEQSVVEVVLPSYGVRVTRADGEHLPDTQLDAWVGNRPVGALATQLRHFYDCIRTGRRSDVVSLDDAVWSIATAEAIVAAASATDGGPR